MTNMQLFDIAGGHPNDNENNNNNNNNNNNAKYAVVRHRGRRSRDGCVQTPRGRLLCAQVFFVVVQVKIFIQNDVGDFVDGCWWFSPLSGFLQIFGKRSHRHQQGVK